MLFTSPVFLFIFAPVVYCIFVSSKGERRIYILLIGSLAFYTYYRPEYALLLLASIGVNHALAGEIERRRHAATLWLGILLNLSVLVAFKYLDFLLSIVGYSPSGSEGLLDLLLPLGISFFTFEQISYLVDVYRRDTHRESLSRYALFVLFFPHLIAGPIIRAREFLPQLESTRRRTRLHLDFGIGMTLFTIGFFKKVFIADKLGAYADPIFDAAVQPGTMSLVDSWVGVMTYSFQIYFDFSGYSDMAIGLARLFGVRLPLNFFSPYRASGPIEFWRRWHMSLSRFVRDYVYFPLGGSRHGRARQFANVLLAMVLVGLWHGAGWQFVVWGGIHGALIVANQAWRAIRPRHWRISRIRVLASTAATFIVVSIAWIPFRAPDLNSAAEMTRTLFGLGNIILPRPLERFFGFSDPLLVSVPGARFENAPFHALLEMLGYTGGFPLLPFAAMIVFLMPNAYQWINQFRPALDYGRQRPDLFAGLLNWSPSPFTATVIGFLLLTAVWFQGRPQAFIYFQF